MPRVAARGGLPGSPAGAGPRPAGAWREAWNMEPFG
jgi:hypothetical protein